MPLSVARDEGHAYFSVVTLLPFLLAGLILLTYTSVGGYSYGPSPAATASWSKCQSCESSALCFKLDRNHRSHNRRSHLLFFLKESTFSISNSFFFNFFFFFFKPVNGTPLHMVLSLYGYDRWDMAQLSSSPFHRIGHSMLKTRGISTLSNAGLVIGSYRLFALSSVTV